MSRDTTFNCWRIGSDFTLFPEALAFWRASQSRRGTESVGLQHRRLGFYLCHYINVSGRKRRRLSVLKLYLILSLLNHSPLLCFSLLSLHCPSPVFAFNSPSLFLSSTTAPYRANIVSLICIKLCMHDDACVFLFSLSLFFFWLIWSWLDLPAIDMLHCLLGRGTLLAALRWMFKQVNGEPIFLYGKHVFGFCDDWFGWRYQGRLACIVRG